MSGPVIGVNATELESLTVNSPDEVESPIREIATSDT